jgi:hypothetical protein
MATVRDGDDVCVARRFRGMQRPQRERQSERFRDCCNIEWRGRSAGQRGGHDAGRGRGNTEHNACGDGERDRHDVDHRR